MRFVRSARSCSVLLVAIVAGACGAPGPAPTESVAPSGAAPSPSAASTTAAVATSEPTAPPTPEPTQEATPEPTAQPVVTPPPLDPDCPQQDAEDVISVQEYVDAPTSCFRSGVRVRGWLDTPPPLGFLPPIVKPSWLYYPDESAASLWHQPPPEPDHVCANGEDCWWFFPHLDPKIDGLAFEPLDRWVILTGHTRDPRAQNCHYDGEGPNPNPELVTICGRQLVVTAIEEAP
jgi:hypothetical protein